LFNPIDHLEMVGGPIQMKRQWKISLAEEPEVSCSASLSLWISDRRKLANVSARKRDRDVSRSRTVFELFVGIAFGLLSRCVSNLDEPRDITQKINEASVTNTHAGACAMAMQLPFVDDLAERG
jgi:hypothetical protein